MTSNPLDDLRQINRAQREAQEPSPEMDLRETVSTAPRTSVLPPVRKAVRKSGRKDVSTDGSEDGSTQVRQDMPHIERPDLRAQVRDTVSEKRVYQGGVKATLDLAPELSKRFKRYSIDHHNVTLRQLLTELLDAYLQGEGY